MKNIVQVAIDAGSFNTLVAAVKAAGLVETLSGPGPFTVFAPADAAFAKLPAGTVEGLLQDKEKLTSILTYHVVSGKVTAADLVNSNGATPTTVNGLPLDIVVREGKVYVNGTQVVTADVQASTRDRVKKGGALAMLNKPVNVEQISAKLNSILGGQDVWGQTTDH